MDQEEEEVQHIPRRGADLAIREAEGRIRHALQVAFARNYEMEETPCIRYPSQFIDLVVDWNQASKVKRLGITGIGKIVDSDFPSFERHLKEMMSADEARPYDNLTYLLYKDGQITEAEQLHLAQLRKLNNVDLRRRIKIMQFILDLLGEDEPTDFEELVYTNDSYDCAKVRKKTKDGKEKGTRSMYFALEPCMKKVVGLKQVDRCVHKHPCRPSTDVHFKELNANMIPRMYSFPYFLIPAHPKRLFPEWDTWYNETPWRRYVRCSKCWADVGHFRYFHGLLHEDELEVGLCFNCYPHKMELLLKFGEVIRQVPGIAAVLETEEEEVEGGGGEGRNQRTNERKRRAEDLIAEIKKIVKDEIDKAFEKIFGKKDEKSNATSKEPLPQKSEEEKAEGALIPVEIEGCKPNEIASITKWGPGAGKLEQALEVRASLSPHIHKRPVFIPNGPMIKATRTIIRGSSPDDVWHRWRQRNRHR